MLQGVTQGQFNLGCTCTWARSKNNPDPTTVGCAGISFTNISTRPKTETQLNNKT